jgi:hypothetical protein
VRLLHRRQDPIFDSECAHCGYYDFLKFERARQDDPEFIALT